MPARKSARERYQQQERENIAIIRNYLDDAKSNYIRLDCPHAQLEQRSARYLHANNGFSRLAFTEVVFDHVQDLVQRIDDYATCKLYLLTLTPAAFAIEMGKARAFEPERFQEHVQRWFGSFNLFGFIEAGFYPRMHVVGAADPGTISFHGHCLVWGTAERTLQRAAQVYKTENRSFIGSMAAAHIKTVPRVKVEEVTGYFFKSPQNKYSVYPQARQKVDRATGEIVEWVYYKQLKQVLRPGERVKLANVLADQYLDYMLLSEGEGREVALNILEEVRRCYEDHEERRS